jgi:two-component SAPR family response regulator
MPGMNGFEFAKKVRDIDGKVKILLILAFEINDCSEISSDHPLLKYMGLYKNPYRYEN